MESLDYLAIASGSINRILTSLTITVQDTCDKIESIRDIYKHIHAAHWHPCCHEYSGLNKKDPYFCKCNKDNTFYATAVLSPLEVLIREMSQEVDYDGNGMVFPNDFVFREDSSLPKVIKTLQRFKIKNIKIPRLTFEQYKNTVNPKSMFG